MFDVKFTSSKNSFNPSFEKVNDVSDGGYERGYADALIRRTELVVGTNGEYTPSEDSTGFKKVVVDVIARSAIDDLIEGNTTELSSDVSKIGNYAFNSWKRITTANFPNATSVGVQAFYNCSGLTSVNIPNATSVGNNAFESCSALTIADLPNATSIGNSAFKSCKKLTDANFPNVTSVGTSAFEDCYGLTSISIPNATSIGDYAFRYSSAFTYVLLPSITTLNIGVLQNCLKLEIVDLPKVTSFSQGYQFYACRSLKAVILRSTEKLCSLSNKNAFDYCHHILGTVDATYNPSGDKDGYFYVPRALVESYQSATNWSNFATQFRALEDYTVDGTITGALDESKI